MGIREDIEKAEYVVVGIGECFGYNWKALENDSRYCEICGQIGERIELQWLFPFLQKISLEANQNNALSEAFEKLGGLLKGKNAYFITTTIDDYIYNSCIPFERIVTPCGGFRQLQCKNSCSEELINVPNTLLQYVQKLYNDMIKLDDIIDKYPECPDCGADLVFNQIGCEHYNEAGYLVKWGMYQKWLEQTMNRDTLLIELGVGLGFMSVIRSPFEKMTSYNRKARLYRVHPTLYMGTPDMEDRCVSVEADPVEWITEII